MGNLLEGLNKEQREAVETTEGPLLVLAGAGSGKTRVLTHRIAYLIEHKAVYPSNILAITFTNKAANEMKSRVDSLVGDISRNMWISTFHAACVRILRKNIDILGYGKNFVIFDYQDQQSCVKECLKELNINEKNFPPKYVLEEIGRAKDNLESPEIFTKKYGSDFRMGKLAQIYTTYQKKLKENNALDFDDIIFFTIKLLKENEDVLSYYQDKFQYIMVDEYQDTNTAQYTLVNLLARKHMNLCVVGDDDQSIYGWRGANIQNILDFEKDFKNTKVIKLEQNYRSTSTILDAANQVIKNNYGRKNKSLRTENGQGDKITYYNAGNEHEEAQFVVDRIKEFTSNGKNQYKDFAILYRINAQSRVFEDKLAKEGIPYKIIGGLKFYDRKEIKDIIAYLRLIENSTDNLALKRIINVPKRGIGNTTVTAIEEMANDRGCSMFSIVQMATQIEALKRPSGKLEKFANFINELKVKEYESVSQLIEDVIDKSGMIRELEEERTIEANSRIENIKELLSVAVEYEKTESYAGLGGFLENIALVTDIDNVEETQNNVILMTLHSAKGLEYPTVFLVGMEEGVFPSIKNLADEISLEEERRLCYVGITRAKEKLYITNARRRTLFGNTSFNKVSLFVNEIDDSLLDNQSKKEIQYIDSSLLNQYMSIKRPKKTLPKYSNFIEQEMKRSVSTSCNFERGDSVYHKRFGNGIISKIEQENNDYKLEIMFEESGMKRMMASLANLEHIN